MQKPVWHYRPSPLLYCMSICSKEVLLLVFPPKGADGICMSSMKCKYSQDITQNHMHDSVGLTPTKSLHFQPNRNYILVC